VINNLRAIQAGADRIHGTALGVGERVGNAALDQTLMNLKLMGELGDRDLGALVPWCRKVATALGVPIPMQYPLVGDDAFRTATGVHAAAVIKAIRKGDRDLADRVYSGVPAGWFGKEQAIEIGFMSRESNGVYWLQSRGIEAVDGLVKHIFELAKSTDHILCDAEVHAAIAGWRASTPA
jgi:2-isopropylmalate synthase